jgi:hypothetical protein
MNVNDLFWYLKRLRDNYPGVAHLPVYLHVPGQPMDVYLPLQSAQTAELGLLDLNTNPQPIRALLLEPNQSAVPADKLKEKPDESSD